MTHECLSEWEEPKRGDRTGGRRWRRVPDSIGKGAPARFHNNRHRSSPLTPGAFKGFLEFLHSSVDPRQDQPETTSVSENSALPHFVTAISLISRRSDRRRRKNESAQLRAPVCPADASSGRNS